MIFLFKIHGKSAHSAQCAKSYVLTRVIDNIPDIDSFEHQCFILKGLLKSEQTKQHMTIIGVYQSLSKSDLYEHRCLGNIKKYKLSGKCDTQQKYREMI